MKVAFIPAGPIEWASSRIRCYWVAEEMSDAVVVQKDEPLPNADVYIWQKRINTDVVRRVQDAYHFWDVCDPSWWWEPNECKEAASVVDGVVASSDALAADFNHWYGEDKATVIPDRIKLSHYSPHYRFHRDSTPVRFIWYGLASNRVALNAAMANLERLAANGHEIALTIMDDRPEAAITNNYFPAYHVRWQLDQEAAVIASHDIALLPPYPGPWGKVKSNNKRLVAHACGLPTTNGLSYVALESLVLHEWQRKLEAQEGADWVEAHYDVVESAREWEALLCAS